MKVASSLMEFCELKFSSEVINISMTKLNRSSFWALVAVGLLSFGLTGCEITHPDSTDRFILFWDVQAVPQSLCVNDTVRVKYRIANECPAGYDCSAFYPTINVSSPTLPSLFPMSSYHVASYGGEIVSNPIPSAIATEINVSSDPRFVLYRSDGTTSYVIHGPPDTIRLRPLGQLSYVYAAPVSLNVTPIDPAVQRVQPIVFEGQCFGRVAGWSAVNFEVGTARSEAVRIRHLRNTDTRRVTYTAHFPSGLPDQQITLDAGAEIDIATESGPTTIGSLSASTSDTIPGGFALCLDAASPNPPAPIRSEVTLGCQ